MSAHMKKKCFRCPLGPLEMMLRGGIDGYIFVRIKIYSTEYVLNSCSMFICYILYDIKSDF